MPVFCELRPRSDATPEQLKELGAALREWAGRELGKGVLCSIDPEGLVSLLAGEPPNPLALQVAAHNAGVSLDQIREDLGELVSERSVRFTVKDEADSPRGKVIESLRESIPATLIEDIVIDDLSWTE